MGRHTGENDKGHRDTSLTFTHPLPGRRVQCRTTSNGGLGALEASRDWDTGRKASQAVPGHSGQGTWAAMEDQGSRVAMAEQGTQAALAEQGAGVAMAEQGTRVAMADQGTRVAMAEQGD